MGLRFTEPLNNDPHNSLHEPLTAENERLLLTWKEMSGKKSTFVARGIVAISDMKDDSDSSC